MIEIVYVGGTRVFIGHPVQELAVIACPLGSDCLGDAASCFAAFETLSRSDESTTTRDRSRDCIPVFLDPDMEPGVIELRDLRTRTRDFIGATAQRCFAACTDSLAGRNCACNPPIDYTSEAQASLLMKLLKHDLVLGMKARAFLTEEERNLLHALHSAATIGA